MWPPMVRCGYGPNRHPERSRSIRLTPCMLRSNRRRCAEWRRKGVGRMLVKAAEDWASSMGHRQLGSDADVENVVGAAAHGAMGFREVETIRCFIKELDSTL